MMSRDIKYTKGSGNVFRDLGFEQPAEELAKAQLASLIYDVITKRELTQKEAASVLGINQPKVSALKNGKLSGFSIERLFSFLRALDLDIDIVVHPKKKKQGRIQCSASALG